MPSSASDQHRAKTSGHALLGPFLGLCMGIACADSAYEQGIDAFNHGDYAAAVAYFLAASPAEEGGALLHYNLGVSYYKLGQYRNAEQSFLLATADPDLAALGYYNLALVSDQLEQPEETANWLRRTLETTDSPKLRALAQAMLERQTVAGDRLDNAIAIAPDSAHAPTPPWSGIVVGEAGYDSNVTLLSDTQILNSSEQDDFFFDMFAHLKRALQPTDSGLQPTLDGNLYAIKYQDIDGYDVDSVRLGGNLEKQLWDWSATAGAHLSYTFLDGDEFTLEPQLNLNASHWLQPEHSRLRVRYEGSRILVRDPLYSYLDGWRHKTDARVTWMRGAQQLHVMYQLETNYREELYEPRFTSYSPIRNSVRLGVETPVGNWLDLALEAQYQHAHYINPNELADGSFVTRKDERIGTIARVTHRFGSGNEISLEYRHTSNRSNLDDYDYRQYITMLGLLLEF